MLDLLASMGSLCDHATQVNSCYSRYLTYGILRICATAKEIRAVAPVVLAITQQAIHVVVVGTVGILATGLGYAWSMLLLHRGPC